MNTFIKIIRVNQVHSHIILYAKGWYETREMVLDLKEIISKTVLVDPIHITYNHVYNHVANTFNLYASESSKREFISSLFRLPDGKYNYSGLFPDDAIRKMLESLCNVVVWNEEKKEKLDLGKPLSSILPLKNNEF